MFPGRDADHVVIPDVEALVALLEVWELPAMANFLLLSSVLHQVTIDIQRPAPHSLKYEN